MESRFLERVQAEGLARCRPMLGTYVEIRIAEKPDDADASAVFEAAFDAAFAAIEQCEKLMSFHDRSSELSCINCAFAGEIIDVHPWTSQVLARAIELFELTEGAPELVPFTKARMERRLANELAPLPDRYFVNLVCIPHGSPRRAKVARWIVPEQP